MASRGAAASQSAVTTQDSALDSSDHSAAALPAPIPFVANGKSHFGF